MNSDNNRKTLPPRPMRGNALLKLIMGSAGGLVLTVSGAQCRSLIDGNLQVDTEPEIYQATWNDPGADLGYISEGFLDWYFPESNE